MAISLAALLGVNSLKLSKAGVAETTWHQDINWVAVTELEDPQRFINGGELILTTGLRLKSAPEQRRFVRQVQRAGAVGIGFGVGLSHDAVPPALLAGGGLTELLKQLGSMLRTDIALTQFTAQLYNSSTAAPAADSWSS